MVDSARPFTPADMAARPRPALPVAPPPRIRFKTPDGYPRRGRRDAVTWVDTGVLVSLGVKEGVPERFVALYGRRWLRTSITVVHEVRRLSKRAPQTPADRDVSDAATAARAALLSRGRERLQVSQIGHEHLATRDQVRQQLRGLSANPKATHGGEAELITLAIADAASAPQVLLSNDAGASVVADQRGLPTRHIGDILCEMACADATLTCGSLYYELEAMTAISRLERSVLPRSADALACRRSGDRCVPCEPQGSQTLSPQTTV